MCMKMTLLREKKMQQFKSQSLTFRIKIMTPMIPSKLYEKSHKD